MLDSFVAAEGEPVSSSAASRDTRLALRGRDLREDKRRALDACAAGGLTGTLGPMSGGQNALGFSEGL